MPTAEYKFDIIDEIHGTVLAEEQRRQLLARPSVSEQGRLKGTASSYVPDEDLRTAINTAIAVGQPLLLTGESGTGKTQAAYYVAHRLHVPLFHFQARSTSLAGDLLYHFDTVRYFHDANAGKGSGSAGNGASQTLNKMDYVTPRELWQAMRESAKTGLPSILLIDEIDKAPRDFPNDLLHEISEMSFQIREDPDMPLITTKPELRPIVFITSNDERRLPDAFLRRCVSHHIELTPERLKDIARAQSHQYPKLSDSFVDLAVDRFFDLRKESLEKKPATGEFLTWLQVLSIALHQPDTQELEKDLADLPYIHTVLKSPDTVKSIRKS